jgi:hypothetical protein
MIARPWRGCCLVLKTGMPWGYLPRELGCGLANRGKRGSKHYLLVDERELAPVAQISGRKVHDPRFLIPCIVRPGSETISKPCLKRPGKLHADQAYASRTHPAWLHHRGITRSNRALWPRVARTAWPMAAGRRAHLGFATPRSLTAHTTRATSRHPPGVSLTCLLAHLFAVCPTLLLGALNAETARPR